MAKKKPPAKRKPRKLPPNKPPQISAAKQMTPEPDYAAAGKHLADAIASFAKAVEAANPKATTASWTVGWS